MNVQEREGDKRKKVEKKDTHTFYHSTKRLHTASCCILFQSLFFHFFFFFLTNVFRNLVFYFVHNFCVLLFKLNTII